MLFVLPNTTFVVCGILDVVWPPDVHIQTMWLKVNWKAHPEHRIQLFSRSIVAPMLIELQVSFGWTYLSKYIHVITTRRPHGILELTKLCIVVRAMKIEVVNWRTLMGVAFSNDSWLSEHFMGCTVHKLTNL